MKIFAWWDSPNSNKNMSRRSWLMFHGFDLDLELSDRFVQGEHLQTLIKDLEIEILKREAELPVLITGGKWRGTIDQELTNIRRRIVDGLKREVVQMKSGKWGPKYTIKTNVEGRLDKSTIETFVPSKEQLLGL